MTWTPKAAATRVAVGAVALGASWPRGARSGVGVEVLDPGAALARRFGISGLPHTVVLDGTGQVRRVFLGAIDRRQLEDALAPLLGAAQRCES